MRYPISFWLWFIPPLWPFLLLITIVWAMSKWAFWLALHLVGVVGYTISTVFYTSVTRQPVSVLSIVFLAIGWVLFAGHLYLFVRWQKGAQRRRYERDVAEARYWQQVGDAARRDP